jgi:hypothetical protein
MGKISEHLYGLLQKLLKDCGIVVWYDPDGVYGRFMETLSMPDTRIFQWKDSFFRLRYEVDDFLEFIDEQGRPDPESHVPPTLLVYIPKERQQSRQALVELEAAGVVMEPGANPWQRNTRLRVIAEYVFRKIAPDQTESICKQVEDGLLSLEELDRLSMEVVAIQTGAIKLIFGTASLIDVALKFASSPEHDETLESKQAMPELAGLFENGFGFQSLERSSPVQLRKELRRMLLMGELFCGEAQSEAMDKYSSLHLPDKPQHLERIREACSVWRSRTDFRPAYVDSAQLVQDEMKVAKVDFQVENLALMHTFPVFEQKLIRYAEEHLLKAKPLDVFHVAMKRKGGFWSIENPDYQLRWALLENGARLLILGNTIRNELKKVKESPEELLLRYTGGEEPWYLLDRTYRHLERQYSYLDFEIREDRGLLDTASVDEQGKVGLYRIEVGCSAGTGKLKLSGIGDSSMKESIQRAFAYLQGHKVELGIAHEFACTDFHVEAIDLLSNRVSCEAGMALVVAICSAVRKHSILPALLVLGDLSIQGNIKPVRSLVEPLQAGMENGARRTLIPLENKRHFLEVSGDIVERVDPIFYGDPLTAVMKSLGVS